MEQILIVSTTTENKEDTKKLAKLLLEKRLIACAQISGPLSSMYWWQGEITESTEFSLCFKTLPKFWDRVKATIERHHPYEVPEIIATQTDKVSDPYNLWVKKELE